MGASSGRSMPDVVGGAIVGVIMPFIRRDMDDTVRKWGRENMKIEAHGKDGLLI